MTIKYLHKNVKSFTCYRMMTDKKSNEILKKLREYYGKTVSGLLYKSIYQLSIAVVLSAQTTDRQVNIITPALFNKFPDFDSMSKALVKDVEGLIKSVGLYKTKARNIVNLSKDVVNKYGNILPDNIDDLMSLPGVGRKSANVILSMGYKKPAFPVDTHVLRIANRLGYAASDSPFAVEKAVTSYVPEDSWIEAHLLFINHGRKLCMARNPDCAECPINNLCDYYLTKTQG